MATINGTPGNDVRNGTAAADRINGLGGNDTLNGLGGNDTLVGGDGDDFYSITANPGADRIIEGFNGGTDTVLSVISYALGAHLENLRLTGTGAINGTGNKLDNEITGNSGANVLNGRGGDDVLTGGGGNDTYVVDSDGDVVTEGAGASGTDTVRSYVDYVLTQTNIENLTLIGPGSKDGTGNTLANVITGNSESNVLSGLNGADTLTGGLGNDVLDGGPNSDFLSGGGGDDAYTVDNAGDTVFERVSRGHDVVDSSVTFTLTDFVEDLALTGSGNISGFGNYLANTIVGNNANNILDGGRGADMLVGRSGNDTYWVDALDTVIEEPGGGIDTIRTPFSFTLDVDAEIENLTLHGSGNFTATGSIFNNVLTGNDGDNLLDGAEGDDTLDGGGGFDTLRGGDGQDVILWDGTDFQADGGSGSDTLRTLNALPLDLRGIGFGGLFVDIEFLDLADANQVFLGDGDVADLSSETDAFNIKGGAGDIVDTSGLWVNNGTVEDDSVTYTEFQSGDELLRVQVGIDISGITEPTINFQLSALNGANGFQISGETGSDFSGVSVSSAGDVDGDGFADFLIGAYLADPNGLSASGASYLVFGNGSFGANLDLSALSGPNGFQISGEVVNDRSGFSVSGAGDVNGDGFSDLVIGALRADPNGNYSGASYVVFGHGSGFDANLDLSALNGANGFQISGETDGDQSGTSVSAAGDVNGDGYDDVLVGASGAGGASGASYVVFGKASGFGSNLDLSALDGTNGFEITGVAANDLSGSSVSGAGDVNGDGYADLLIGAIGADPHGDLSGASYVVFGKASGFGSSIELGAFLGSSVFKISGEAASDFSGGSVSAAGDVNGDGYADLVIGANGADPHGGASGASYVVFGASDLGASEGNLDLSALDGANGFQISGEALNDYSGVSISGAGDVNGDGYADLLIGANGADPNGAFSGASYVVFGRASGFGANLDLAALDGATGFQISGEALGEYSGRSVSAAGDVDGDGFDDLLIGANRAGPHGGDSGASYVIYGRDFRDEIDPLLIGNDGNNFIGVATSAGNIHIGGAGDDTMFGGDGADVYRGGKGDDRIEVSDDAFLDLSGGAGRDTLALMLGLDLNLSDIADSKLTGIEVIDLQAAGGSSNLTLTVMELLELSDTSNTLVVDGGAGDHLTIDGTWIDDGLNDDGYAVYIHSTGAARLEVALAIEIEISII